MDEKTWFTKEQLTLMAQPSVERIIEKINCREYEEAIIISQNIKQEYGFLRRMMVDSAVELLNFIENSFKERDSESLIDMVNMVWKPAFVSIQDRTRRKVAGEITERWHALGIDVHDPEFIHQFSRELLNEMTLLRKDKEIVAKLNENNDSAAKEISMEFNHEWGILHDLLVESIAALLTAIGNRYGEEKVGEALKFMTEKVWKDAFKKINSRDRQEVVAALAATWRAHSTGGVGPEAGGFSIEEDNEKFTFKLEPCGSGQRLWKRGEKEADKRFGKTRDSYLWSFNREDFPFYCAHCTYMNEIMPIEWSGAPVYPLDPPKSPDHHCTWYYYKKPEDTSERFYERYGYNKEIMLQKNKTQTGKQV